MGTETWKLISYVPFGRDVKGVFACRVCGYTTTYIGRGKAPSYSCPKCGEKAKKETEKMSSFLAGECKTLMEAIYDYIEKRA